MVPNNLNNSGAHRRGHSAHRYRWQPPVAVGRQVCNIRWHRQSHTLQTLGSRPLPRHLSYSHPGALPL